MLRGVTPACTHCTTNFYPQPPRCAAFPQRGEVILASRQCCLSRNAHVLPHLSPAFPPLRLLPHAAEEPLRLYQKEEKKTYSTSLCVTARNASARRRAPARPSPLLKTHPPSRAQQRHACVGEAPKATSTTSASLDATSHACTPSPRTPSGAGALQCALRRAGEGEGRHVVTRRGDGRGGGVAGGEAVQHTRGA